MSLPSALQAFATQPLLTAARGLFKDTLTIPLSPLADAAITPQRFFRDAYRADRHAGIDNLYLVGRITDDSFHAAKAAAGATDLDANLTAAAADDYQGMFLIAADLGSRELTRSDLAARTREINRTFSAPVIVVFKHTTAKQPVLSIGVASRRPHKRDKGKDVLGKVSMIREIHPQSPHRGHLEILKDFSLAELEKNAGKGKRGHKIDSYKAFHAALEQIFNTDLLNARFYKELANWYFWALPQVRFPNDTGKDSDEKHQASSLIRLITRLIFCWFLKQKDGLVPETLFNPEELSKLLKGFDPESETSSTYYHAILQNLFFATLNQRMGKDSKGNPYRVFATDAGFQKNKTTYDVNNLYRYETLFKVSQDEALALFADIPFLNGGLFECLDRTEDGTNKKLYLDGFSRNSKKRPHVPDRLFFDSGETADLSEAYGDKKRKKEAVTGLIPILNRYKFTIVENTPIDQEIALDPELLGQIFENLLASYNEETKTTARKQTGSFYTPRPIVEYMVDESLKAYFSRILVEKAGMKEEDAKAGLDLLFTYTEKDHPFSDHEVAILIAAIDDLKILDPAVGSGAFPMGVLHKLVYILGKLDPDNERWKQTQLAKLDSAPMREALEAAFEDNNDDYGRKLYLIENCLYGVDIQPIAIQITKLRFFISLVCDQKTNRNKKDNHGIRPLPNLETKFVAANSLIGLPKIEDDLYHDGRIDVIEKEIESLYHNHFSIQRRDQKLSVQRKIKALRQELTSVLTESLGYISSVKSKHITEWDPFDPQSSAGFFDPHWMFGRRLAKGFDVVIGNPPYLASYSRESVGMTEDEKSYFAANYTSTSGRINTFILFTERSCSLASELGHVSFIVPKPFLMMTAYQNTRRLVTKLSMRIVVDCREEVFTGACVPTCIFLFQQKKSPANHNFDIFEYGRRGFQYLRVFQNSQATQDSECRINVTANEDAQKVLQKILKIPTTLSDFCHVEDGINPGPFRKWLVTEQSISENCVKLIEGKNFHRYLPISWKGKWFLWDKPNIKLRQKEFPNSIAVLGDDARFRVNEKIVTRQTADGIIATLDQDQYFSTNSVHTTRLRDNVALDLKFILGVLNSNLVRFFFQNQFKEKENAFPQVKVNKLRKIPIPKVSMKDQVAISQLASSILVEKKLRESCDVTELEREIDQHVYALYGLTPEEIAIVEAEGK